MFQHVGAYISIMKNTDSSSIITLLNEQPKYKSNPPRLAKKSSLLTANPHNCQSAVGGHLIKNPQSAIGNDVTITFVMSFCRIVIILRLTEFLSSRSYSSPPEGMANNILH